MARWVWRWAYAPAALALAVFFAFVGGNKALAPLADLARHHAWTIWLPEWLGRLIGVTEVLCALALLAGLHRTGRRWAMGAAIALIVNQAVAGAVHAAHAETGALPQNGILAGMAAAALILRAMF